MEKNKLCGMLGLATKAGKIVFGTEACMADLEKGKVKLLLLAEDSAERTKKHFKQICQAKEIPVLEILEIEELSKVIGKENKAVVGVKDEGFSKAIMRIIDGGEE